jgi:hypothetical protein
MYTKVCRIFVKNGLRPIGKRAIPGIYGNWLAGTGMPRGLLL